jgi:hypothetical protein
MVSWVIRKTVKEKQKGARKRLVHANWQHSIFGQFVESVARGLNVVLISNKITIYAYRLERH